METKLILPETIGSEIIIREGHALPVKEPVKILLSGDIHTVSNYLKIRNEQSEIDIKKAVVISDKSNLSIKLLLDPANSYGGEIASTLEKSDELQPFRINENKTFTKEELVKLIKFNKIYFDDAAKHAEMLLAFQKVSSTVNIRSNESADDRGNKERQFVKDVTTNAPTEFILNIPIFKGFPNVRFRVEVCLDVTEGSARFWFESVELHELMQTQIEQIFTEELKSAEGFVIVNK